MCVVSILSPVLSLLNTLHFQGEEPSGSGRDPRQVAAGCLRGRGEKLPQGAEFRSLPRQIQAGGSVREVHLWLRVQGRSGQHDHRAYSTFDVIQQ